MYSSFVCSLFMTKSYMTTFRGGAASTAAPVKVGRTPAEFQPCPPSVRLQYVSVRRLPSSFASANRFGLARSRLSSTPLLRPPVRRSVTRAADGQTDGRGSEREGTLLLRHPNGPACSLGWSGRRLVQYIRFAQIVITRCGFILK